MMNHADTIDGICEALNEAYQLLYAVGITEKQSALLDASSHAQGAMIDAMFDLRRIQADL